MRILAIGAHYDDIEIGCSGTLIKHIMKGDEVYLAIIHSDEYRTGDVDIRYQEQLSSLQIMNVNTQLFLCVKDDDDSDIISTLDSIEADVIFCQHEQDTHQHHRHSSIIGQAVGRKRHTTTLFYDGGSSYNFYPNVFSMIDFNKKIRVLKCFDSQIKHGAINLDILEKKNAYWASIITEENNKFAEGFVARKMRWGINENIVIKS